jgi:hypothetical protein
MAGLLDTLAQTWPVRLAQTAWNAVKLPGDVYSGRTPITGPDGYTNPQVINRSADLAGLVTMGATAAPAETNAVGMGIRAYHGSPYDFNKFDLGKIGTGEGAQAYGHGLYFAENPQVAQQYRDALAAPTRPGRMYEVNINADPQHMLPWDEALAPDMAQAVRPLVDPSKLSAFDHFTKVGVSGADAYKDFLGGGLYRTRAQASANLDAAGIPGIRYADQGSRGLDAGSGTNNYVVFNPHLIDILKKYGIAGAMGLGSAPAWLPQQNGSVSQ